MLPRKIAIFTGAQMGFGDLVFASRLANYVREHIPGYEVELLAEKEDLLKLESLGMKAKNINEFQEKDYKGVIIGPGVISLEDEILKQLKDTPITLVSEYDYENHFESMSAVLNKNGCENVTKIKSGLSEDCEGILIEPKLLPKGEESCYTPQPTDWDELSNGNLKNKLLGSPGSYRDDRTLSLAYCSKLSSYQVPIIHANYAADNKEIKNYDLVMVATEMTSQKLERIRKKLNPILKKGGFNKLVFIDADEQKANVEPDDDKTNKNDVSKEFRVILTKQIQHKDMMALHKITGKEFTTITGDQSLTEAISKGVMFHYLFTGAGHKIGFVNSLMNLAKKEGYENLPSYFKSDRDPVGSVIYKKSMEEEFIKFCNHVRNKHDLGAAIVKSIQKTFALDRGAASLPSDTKAVTEIQAATERTQPLTTGTPIPAIVSSSDQKIETKLTQLLEGQDWIVKSMQSLGYTSAPAGVCNGIGGMGAQAILTKDRHTFNQRLHLIKEQIEKIALDPEKTLPVVLKEAQDKRTKLISETKLAFLQNLNEGKKSEKDLTPEQKKQLYEAINKKIDAEITLEEKILLDVPAFFEGVELYQQARLYPEFFEGKENLNRQDFDSVSPLVASQLLDGKISKIGVELGIYTEKELENYFSGLHAEFDKKPILTESVSLILRSSNHTITVGYDPTATEKKWCVIDANHLDNQDMDDEQALAKRVKSAFALRDSENDVTTFSASIYTTSQQSDAVTEKIRAWKTSESWKNMHEVTPEKAQLSDRFNASWLFMAAKTGKLEDIKKLVAKGGNVNQTRIPIENYTPTPMSPGIENGEEKPEKGRMYYKLQEIENSKDLILTYITSDLTKPEVLTVSPEDANAISLIGIVSNRGHILGPSALYMAIHNGYDEEALELMKNGANIDQVVNEDMTMILFAVQENRIEIVKELLRRGTTKMDESRTSGLTPFFIAIEKGNIEIARMLLNKNPNLNPIREHDKATPLSIAINQGNIDLVKLLLDAGADVTKKCTSDNVEPLILAIEKGNIEISRMLLDKNPNLNPIREHDEATPLSIVINQGNIDLVKLLLDVGADVSKKCTSNNIEPLRLAARKGNIDMVKLLLEAGANPKAGIIPIGAASKGAIQDLLKEEMEKQLDRRERFNEIFLHNFMSKHEIGYGEVKFANPIDPPDSIKQELNKLDNNLTNEIQKFTSRISEEADKFKKLLETNPLSPSDAAEMLCSALNRIEVDQKLINLKQKLFEYLSSEISAEAWGYHNNGEDDDNQFRLSMVKNLVHKEQQQVIRPIAEDSITTLTITLDDLLSSPSKRDRRIALRPDVGNIVAQGVESHIKEEKSDPLVKIFNPVDGSQNLHINEAKKELQNWLKDADTAYTTSLHGGGDDAPHAPFRTNQVQISKHIIPADLNEHLTKELSTGKWAGGTDINGSSQPLKITGNITKYGLIEECLEQNKKIKLTFLPPPGYKEDPFNKNENYEQCLIIVAKTIENTIKKMRTDANDNRTTRITMGFIGNIDKFNARELTTFQKALLTYCASRSDIKCEAKNDKGESMSITQSDIKKLLNIDDRHIDFARDCIKAAEKPMKFKSNPEETTPSPEQEPTRQLGMK